jgi:hypothetical protein
VGRRKPPSASSNAPSDDAPPEFEGVVAQFRSDSRVTREQRFSSRNVLSVSGKIFAMYVRGEFVVKLPRERAESLLSSGAAKSWGPGTGRIMKEWVAIVSGPGSWPSLAREANEYVGSPRGRP